eukprot:TRINITY_DN51911_c0_g1_i1.p1 TRINITY_DN51911_c0_g1~~TRINITY_DN51911_c0_g1_i1.p1  ORF type:complete len:460 (+),score=78.99 TRINITY_DN51911_c0_g1_i1:138-1517(+)
MKYSSSSLGLVLVGLVFLAQSHGSEAAMRATRAKLSTQSSMAAALGQHLAQLSHLPDSGNLTAIMTELLSVGTSGGDGSAAVPNVMQYVPRIRVLLKNQIRVVAMKAANHNFAIDEAFTKLQGCTLGKDPATGDLGKLSDVLRYCWAMEEKSYIIDQNCKRELKPLEDKEKGVELILKGNATKKGAQSYFTYEECDAWDQNAGVGLREYIKGIRDQIAQRLVLLTDTKKTLSKSSIQAKTKRADCKASEKAYLIQRRKCKRNQEYLEMTACKLLDNDETCLAYNQCYDGSNNALINAQAVAKVEEPQIKKDYNVLLRMDCVLDAFTEAKNMAGLQEMLELCYNTEVPVVKLTAVDIHYHVQVPERRDCRAGQVNTPGTFEFQQKYLKGPTEHTGPFRCNYHCCKYTGSSYGSKRLLKPQTRWHNEKELIDGTNYKPGDDLFSGIQVGQEGQEASEVIYR